MRRWRQDSWRCSVIQPLRHQVLNVLNIQSRPLSSVVLGRSRCDSLTKLQFHFIPIQNLARKKTGAFSQIPILCINPAMNSPLTSCDTPVILCALNKLQCNESCRWPRGRGSVHVRREGSGDAAHHEELEFTRINTRPRGAAATLCAF